MFLEECNYIVKEKEVTRYITEELEISSDDSVESDEERSKSSHEQKTFVVCKLHS